MSIFGIIFWLASIFIVYYWSKDRGLPELPWTVASAIFPFLTLIALAAWLKYSQGYIFSKDMV